MKRVFFIIVLTLLLSSSYLIIGVNVAPQGLVFLGRRNVNSQDTYVNLSNIEQVRSGNLLFTNLYSSEPQPTIYFRPVYIIAGFLARVFTLSSIVSFHAMRIILGVIFLLTAWKFLGLFFNKREERLIAFCLLCFSSGLAMDFWIPEAITFLSLAESPHFILSQLLLISIFGLFLLRASNRKSWHLLLAGICMLILSFDHPYDPPIILLAFIFYATILSIRHGKIEWRVIGDIGLITLPAIIGFGYYLWPREAYPSILSFQQQNNSFTPPFSYILLGYGLLVPLSLVGIKRAMSHNESKGLLVLSWIVASVVLLYSPFNAQRRFINGLHIPLIILSAYGVKEILRKLSHYSKKFKWRIPLVQNVFLVLLIPILFIANGYSIYDDWKAYKADKTDYYYYYLPKSEISAIYWLRNNTPKESIIGTNWFYGNIIPGLTGRHVYLGHRVSTLNPDQKTKEIEDFVNIDTDEQAKAFLTKSGITYLFFGVEDSLLRGNYKPQEKTYLQQVYNRDGDTIYKVIDN